MSKYDPKKIEPKWQKFWEKNQTFEVKEDSKKKKFYSLIEFPYPSGAGLHVGHPRPFTAMDVVSRKKRMEGFNVLYPIGFDAFGLPTENYALKTGRPPAEITAENIANFTRQLKSLGYSFDWSRQVNTSDPSYYKWTQQMFLQFFKHGLAYKKNQPINWCPKDKIGLANEEVVNGCCERCGTQTEKRDKEQWMIAITKYADKLLEGLKDVDYITPARVQQENWIGKSEGAEITFSLNVPGQEAGKHKVTVFTTRPDTLFGVTFLAISADMAQKWIDVGWQASAEVKKYVTAILAEQAKANSRDEEPEKTGVASGVMAVNPVSGEEVPVWITNYVLSTYGTGAVMAVPGHDERDWEFAKKYNLPIKEVIKGGDISEKAFVENGVLVNSDFINGLEVAAAKEKVTSWLEEKKIGKRKVNFKLRDWVFSRQRYWGEPIPLVHCENCATKKQKALIIHGFEGSATSNWYMWMKNQLEARGFEVVAPSVSTSEHPTVDSWLAELVPLVKDFGEDDIIIGHSLGSKAALHILDATKKKIKHLFLVASAIGEMMERDWDLYRREWKGADVDALKGFWETPVSFDVATKYAGKVTVILSDDDPWIIKKTHDKLPREWQFNLWHGFKHFTAKEEPELLQEILKSKNQNPGWIPLPESELPLKLPEVKKYEPTDNGESPLAAMKDWVNTKCPRCGGKARRETDIMPNWAGSSWYFLRYADAHNDKEFASAEKLQYWTPVDWYNGGMEHTVLHLLYSRFWNQFLYDIGMVPTSEPYKKRTSHGLIMGPDGEKMSKSRGNVINPDEMVDKFGADALRTYIMFMGPFDQPVAWDTNGLIGVRRFLDRVWGLQEKVVDGFEEKSAILSGLHQTIKKVSDDIEKMSFNTAIAKMMELSNELVKEEKISKSTYQIFIKLLSAFAPHIAEELWEMFGTGESLAYSAWPVFDANLAKESTINLVIQINGKVRDTIDIAAGLPEDEIKHIALNTEKVLKWLEGKEPKKVICVQGKLVSIVI